MSIGHNIRKLREFKDIKRAYMAKQLGIGVTAYGNLERGTSAMTDDRKKQIADILGVTQEELEQFGSGTIVQHNQNSTSGGGVIGNNSSNVVNENQAEILELYKQNMQVMEQMAALIQKVLDKLS